MFNENEWEKKQAEQLRTDAKVELTKLEAMKVLIKNNNLGCEIHIAGMTMGLCENKKILPVIEFQIKEINKFLKGEKNSWI